jgi:hypothetical protein
LLTILLEIFRIATCECLTTRHRTRLDRDKLDRDKPDQDKPDQDKEEAG